MSRNCNYVARVRAKSADFPKLIEAANRAVNGGDRFVEIQQEYMAFYFDHSYALAKFIKFTGDHGFDLVIEPSSSGALDVKEETKTSQDLRSTSARQGDRRVGNAKSRSLFHYTSSDGLVGILGSKTLHASHYNFLNDNSEGRMLRELLIPLLAEETRTFIPRLIEAGFIKPELLTAYGNNYCEDEVGRMFDAMASATDNVSPFFIASFCLHEEGTDQYADGLLSQWRGYARGGFAIEFDELKIDQLTKQEYANWRLQGILTNAVWYHDLEEFVQVDRFKGFAATLFKAVLEQVLPKARSKLIEILGDRTTEDYGGFYLSTVPFLKDSSFEEEHEYRIVTLCNRIGVAEDGDERKHKKLHFRSRPDGRITPFIKLFEETTSDFPIKSIVVGPHPHQQSQLAAARLIVAENGIDCEVRASRIPFRE